jgi:hypothetical protein
MILFTKNPDSKHPTFFHVAHSYCTQFQEGISLHFYEQGFIRIFLWVLLYTHFFQFHPPYFISTCNNVKAKVELHVTNNCNGEIKKSKDNCEDRNYTQSCLLKRFSFFLIFDPFHLDFLQLHLLLCCIVLAHYVVFCCNAFSRFVFVSFKFPKNFDQKNAEGNNQAKEQPAVNQLKKLSNLNFIQYKKHGFQ